jgi:hypothetical protein
VVLLLPDEELPMARTAQRTGPRTCMHALARLPCWACLALAAGSYAALHAVAMRPEVIVMDATQFGRALPGLLAIGAAQDLQYLLPALLLLRLPLLRFLAGGVPAAAPAGNGMSARDFEQLTGEGLALRED